MEIDDITGNIIGTALNIHRGLGPGLLESVYEAVLAKKIEQKGLKVLRATECAEMKEKKMQM